MSAIDDRCSGLRAVQAVADVIAWADQQWEAYLTKARTLPVPIEHTRADWLQVAADYIAQGARLTDGVWTGYKRRLITPTEILETRAAEHAMGIPSYLRIRRYELEALANYRYEGDE